ncbi:MAG: glycoside hydrolase family 13 protein [Actinomycetota bacterium]
MTVAETGTAPWWQQAVTYQVYIRSFADGDGDGTGDLAGLRSRLGYLRDLGVDAIWINPWYRSPLHDGGYDVADYRDIDPRYGTLDEAQLLIDEAHAMGIKVLADLVPNHTSDEHAWFRRALAAEPGDPARGRYLFRPGSGPGGDEPPNNWRSVFGGGAWSRVDDGEWYLHLFDATQPDLDWSNPDVREEFLDVLGFWFDRGIDGFRVDVAHGLAKDPRLPDVAPDAQAITSGNDGSHPFWDRDEVHDIIRDWRRVADGRDGDKVLVAEAWVAPDRLPNYIAPDQYHQSFNFDFLKAAWDAPTRRQVIDRSIALMHDLGSVPTWVLSNHDVIRHATRFALPGADDPMTFIEAGVPHDVDLELGQRRARAGALLMLALPGSVYLYQGEELGLPEVSDLPEDVLDDPIWARSGHTIRGRDGCRVPIPWTREGPSFGFGAGEAWLPQPELFGELSVEAQVGEADSTLELYRTALAVRRKQLAGSLDFEWIDAGEDVLAFRRGALVNVTNLGREPVDLLPGEVVLSSAALVEGCLPGDTSVWIVER